MSSLARPPACARASLRRSAPRSAAESRAFRKYHGLGNDFVLVDDRRGKAPSLTPEQAARACDRNFGVGGDGVIFALPPKEEGSDVTMRIYNSDGSEPEMCGNGIRCLARFLYDVDLEAYKAAGSDGDAGDFSPALRTPSVLRIDTLAGLIVPEIVGDDVRVDMGEPILEAAAVPTALEPNAEGGACVKAPLEVAGKTWLVTTVSMGNPHAIVFGNTDEDITDVYAGIDLAALGPQFESDAAFPARTNTEFVEVVSRDYCKMRVWERGAGPTLACGTGACATVVAGVLEGRLDRKCTVELPGGPLHIEWEEATNKIYMTGAACESFRGEAIFS